jgi:hypothetical protein
MERRLLRVASMRSILNGLCAVSRCLPQLDAMRGYR